MAPKSVLITGCSEGGIGHALALEWHKQGYRVFATARNTSAMQDLEKTGIETLAMDVTDTTSLKSVKEEVEKRTGGTLDVLVNNAGQGTPPAEPRSAVLTLGYTMPVLDVDIDIMKKVYDVNLYGVIRTTQVFSSLVIAAQGTIVIIGSIAGIMPYVFGGTPLRSPLYQPLLQDISNISYCRRIQLE